MESKSNLTTRSPLESIAQTPDLTITLNQLNERIFGMFAMLVLVILISVWAFNVPPLIRYAVTIAAGLIFVYCKSMATKRKKDLDALRQQQAKEHSRNI